MSSPLVTIVLPTHNRMELLPAAVQSCLGQTCRDLELIVVDDGSTDATPEVARKLAATDSRMRVVRQSNSGLPTALNRGFLEARGQYWTWTSDDNRYHSGAVEVMVKELEVRADCGMVYTDFQIIDSAGKIREVVQGLLPELLSEKNVVGPCFLYRSELARKVGTYDPELQLVEDWDYWLRLAIETSLVHIGGINYDYLDHGGTLTHQRQVGVWEAELKMRHRTFHPQARRKIYRWPVARRLATHHWAAGNPLRALWYRMQSLPL